LVAANGQGAQPTLTRAWTVAGAGVGSPAADADSIYFLSASHEVVAVEPASGRVRWRRPTNESGYGGTGTTVLVSGTVVVVGDYNLLAFDRATGTLRWRFVPTEGYGPGFYLSPGVDGLVFAGSPSGRVYAVEAETGRLRWTTVVSADGKTTVFPPRVGGTVVAAGYTEFVAPNRGGVVLMSADTGRIEWRRAFPLPQDRSLGVNWAGGPVFSDDLVVASSGDGVIHAFDIATGADRWSIPRVATEPGNLISSDRDFRALALAGGRLVSGSLTGVVIGYDLETREEVWRFTAGRLGSVVFRIEAADNRVYIPFAGGTLLALGMDTGVEQWQIGDWRTGFLWPPVRWNNLMLVTGGVDGLSAFHLDE
jgi:outer membrane protein assembly factor BamB